MGFSTKASTGRLYILQMKIWIFGTENCVGFLCILLFFLVAVKKNSFGVDTCLFSNSKCV